MAKIRTQALGMAITKVEGLTKQIDIGDANELAKNLGDAFRYFALSDVIEWFNEKVVIPYENYGRILPDSDALGRPVTNKE